MIKVSYDLHIHSCLSPCGDDGATPSLIAGLAKIAGLDVAALTDHNTAKNCPAFFKAAEAYGLLPIAGMELTTEEEIHVLCLFPKLEYAMDFDKSVYEKLLPIKNDVQIFGNQLIMNEEDEIIGTVENCLINAVSIDLYSLSGVVREYGGIIVPAHIDRNSFSLTSSLGYVPDDCGFDAVEIYNVEKTAKLTEEHSYLSSCKIIHNSDAHITDRISRPVHFLEIEELSAEGVLKAISIGYSHQMSIDA